MGVMLLKELFSIIGYPLLHVANYNCSLKSGVFPNNLKINTVVPIPKINNSIKVSELRPINLLPFCEKLLEKFVFKQLSAFFEENQLLYYAQSGFRKTFSCKSALQYVINRLENSVRRQ